MTGIEKLNVIGNKLYKTRYGEFCPKLSETSETAQGSKEMILCKMP